MKKIVFYTVLIASSIFSISLNATEGIAVIDYRTVFLGTDLARERFEDLRESSDCLLYTSPSPRDKRQSRMPSSA